MIHRADESPGLRSPEPAQPMSNRTMLRTALLLLAIVVSCGVLIQADDPESVITALQFVVMIGTCYFLPTIVAMTRKVQTGPVVVLNLFLGWTFIGWVIALALACSPDPSRYSRPGHENG